MKYFKLCFSAFIVMLIISSCDENKVTIIPDGTYINSIKDSVVTAVDGAMYHLDREDGDRVYFLIRHAEKDTMPVDNPILTEEGLQRANFLAEMMKGTRVDAIYSTLYTRTLFTVDTLAARKGLKLFPYEPKDLKLLYESITSNDNIMSAVVVGHSNTTPALANVILGKQEFDKGFDESDYDNFLIVIEKPKANNIVHKLRYRPQ